MMWTYATMLITPEDRADAARPKKYMFCFCVPYVAACVGIWYTKQVNPEIYFKKILL